MFSKKNWLLRYLVPAIAVLGAAIGWISPSYALVQWFVIDSTQTANFSPVPLGSSTPGSSVSYTIYTGRDYQNFCVKPVIRHEFTNRSLNMTANCVFA